MKFPTFKLSRFRHRTRFPVIRPLLGVVATACLSLFLLTIASHPTSAHVEFNSPPESVPCTSSVNSSDTDHFDRPVLQGAANATPIAFDMHFQKMWEQHAHLVVLAVLGTDKPIRRTLRNSQRETWMRYPEVATRATSFQGLLLALFAVSPRHCQPPFVSDAMQAEMRQNLDVLLLRIKEEAPTINRPPGYEGRGYGINSQVSSTRKTLLYMLYAYNNFPTTPFLAKCDDDSFIYVPEYLRMVKQLPRINTVYGYVTMDRDFENYLPIRGTLGMGYTVSRDIFRDVVTEPNLSYLLSQPFNPALADEYNKAMFVHEDATIGRTLELRFGPNSSPRAIPSAPPEDARLPLVEGWGKAYTEYVSDPLRAPSTGRAVSSDGSYNVTYTFPPRDQFVPGRVLWVGDNCRFLRKQKRPSRNTSVRGIVAHRPITPEDFRIHWDFNEELGDDQYMQRPTAINVEPGSFFYDIRLVLKDCRALVDECDSKSFFRDRSSWIWGWWRATP